MNEVRRTSSDPIQNAIEALLERGKKCGYVTWEEMNEILPDDAVDPSQLEMILLRLEEAKIETLDEADALRASRKNAAPPPPPAKRTAAKSKSNGSTKAHPSHSATPAPVIDKEVATGRRRCPSTPGQS